MAKMNYQMFIIAVEESYSNNLITKTDRGVLIKDIEEIIGNVNENGTTENKFFISGNKYTLGVATSTYRRIYSKTNNGGVLLLEEWFRSSVAHRVGGKPAYIMYHPNGRIKVKQWYMKGQRNCDNDDKAFVITYNEDGSVLPTASEYAK